jgi:hypothetical protein
LNGYIGAILSALFIALIVVIWFIYKWYNDNKFRRRSDSVIELVTYCIIAAILLYILGYWVVSYIAGLFVPI